MAGEQVRVRRSIRAPLPGNAGGSLKSTGVIPGLRIYFNSTMACGFGIRSKNFNESLSESIALPIPILSGEIEYYSLKIAIAARKTSYAGFL